MLIASGIAGEEPTRYFLDRIGFDEEVIEQVVPLVTQCEKLLQALKIRKEFPKFADKMIEMIGGRVGGRIDRLCRVVRADLQGEIVAIVRQLGDELASRTLGSYS